MVGRSASWTVEDLAAEPRVAAVRRGDVVYILAKLQ